MSATYPERECPRYERCSVNFCPLDADQDRHSVHKLDKEQKCPMEKRVRVRIGSQYPDLLPMGGLTSREWSGAQRMAKLSSAEKEALAERGREALKRLNAHKRGKIGGEL